MSTAHALPSSLTSPSPLRPGRRTEPLPRVPTPLMEAAPAARSPGFGNAEVHGLRNPLAGVRATVQLALLQCAANPELGELLADALAEVDRLDDRIRALLTLHQPQDSKPRLLDLAELIEDVACSLESRCEAQEVELSWQIAPELRSIEADPDLLEDVLLELGQNALRACPSSGELCIEARLEGDHIEIRVRDSGSGVPSAIRERIFDAFFTTRTDGTGIGLASMRRRLEQAGGALGLESSTQAGSCFLVCLPHRP